MQGAARTPRPRGRHLPFLTLAALVALVAGVGTWSAVQQAAGPTAEQRQPPRPSIRPTTAAPSGKLDLSALPIPRTSFCDALARDEVARALGGPVTSTARYGNGDDVQVRPGYVDVSHEYGCTFSGSDGAAAKTWVFARPVNRHEAKTFIRRERGERGCTFPQLVGFGKPDLTSVCEVKDTKQGATAMRTRLEGLFGSTWLACEVSHPLDQASAGSSSPGSGGSTASQASRSELVQLAQQWCVNVVTTVGARP